MKYRIAFPVVLAWLFFSVGAPAMPDCDAKLKSKDSCKIGVLELHPTQFCVGMREVNQKVDELEKLGKKGGEDAEKDFLKKKLVPAVIGPHGVFYLTDHHHLVLAAERSHIAHVYAEIQANWSDLSPETFWAEMEKKNWVYLHDENGVLIPDPNRLPSDVRGLVDDPYRSLAGAAREAGAYDKSDKPFAEFLWADFFRHIPIQIEKGEEGFQRALKEAEKLAHSDQAQAADLPGYRKN